MDKNLMKRVRNFKKFLTEDMVRVPTFKDIDDMEDFLNNTPSGTTFDMDIINPETSETEWDSIDPWINPQDEIDANANREAEEAALDEPYYEEAEEFEYHSNLDQYDFEDIYVVSKEMIKDTLTDDGDINNIENEYDVDSSYIKSISRADGKEFTSDDVNNINAYFADFKGNKLDQYVPSNIDYSIYAEEGKQDAPGEYSFN